MSYTIAGVFRPDLGSAADGLTVQAYPVNGFGSPPALGTTPPGSPPYSGTTGTTYGDHGAWNLEVDNEDYFIVVEYSSSYYWQRYNAPAWLDGSSPPELDVGTLSSAFPITVQDVPFGGFNPSPTPGSYTVPVGTTNEDSVNNGDSGLAAYIDHQHAGLGQPIGETGATDATKYIGGTSGAAPSGGTYDAGDFAIDQTGAVWIYNGTDWVEILPGTYAGASGDIKAIAGIATPTGWLACDGTAYSSSAYATLFGVLTHSFSGSSSNTSNELTGLSPTDTAQLQLGWPITGEYIPSGTTITAVGSTTLLMSADATGTGTSFVAAPWGVSGTSSPYDFNVPDLRGRTVVGQSSIGTNGQPSVVLGGSEWAVTSGGSGSGSGEAQHLLDDDELAGHTHTFTTGYEDAHFHGYSTVQGPGASGIGGDGYIGPTNLDTSGNSGHDHTGTTDAVSSNSYAHNNMQPFAGINYIIKT